MSTTNIEDELCQLCELEDTCEACKVLREYKEIVTYCIEFLELGCKEEGGEKEWKTN